MPIRSVSIHSVKLFLTRSLLVYAVVIFFCSIGVYLSLAVSPRLEPQYWLGLLVLLVGVLAVVSPQHRFEVLRTPLFFWCLLFLALTFIFFMTVPPSYAAQLKERIRDVVLMTALLSIFLMLRDELEFLRKLICWGVLLGVIINLISIAHNGFLLPAQTIYGQRPAGFYINPNESATALIFGMILGIGVLPQRWRIAFSAFVFVGVVATFSREAIMAWVIVAISLCIFRIINWKRLLLWTFILVIAAVVITFILIKIHVIEYHIWSFYHFQLRRLAWFVPGMQHGVGVHDRLNLLKAGWELFLKHPWIGNGIGSTLHWALQQSTHNMYLYYMDDYGIIGLFLYPLLVWCTVYRSAGETRKLAWIMAIFLLFWGLFDHNVVQNYYSLFSISLTAAMSRISLTRVLSGNVGSVSVSPH